MKLFAKHKISPAVLKAEKAFAMKELGKKLQAGLDSGIGEEVTPEFWKKIYKKYGIK